MLFSDDESGRRALLKHKNRIGNRYIELFRTTQAEVQQIINRIQQRPANSQQQPPTTTNSTPIMPIQPAQIQPKLQFHQVEKITNLINIDLKMSKRDCLRMRGLPYEAKPEQIADFLGPHAQQIADQVRKILLI